MTKSMWVAVSILFLLFAGCGLFMVLLQEEQDAKTVQNYINHLRLSQQVHFKTLDFSVSNAYQLKGISLNFKTLPDFKIKIDSFNLGHYYEKNGVPTSFSFSAKKVRFNLMNLAKSIYTDNAKVVEDLALFNPAKDMLNKPLFAVLLAGCNDTKAKVIGNFLYNTDTQEMTLKGEINDVCLGDLQASVSFENITNEKQGQLFVAFTNLLKNGDFLKNFNKFLEKTSVSAFSISYKETGLVQGYKRFVDTVYLRLPNTQSPANLDNNEIQKIISYLSFSNAHRQRNSMIANKIADFVENPNLLHLENTSTKPVAIDSLHGDFLRKITDLFLRLKVSLQVKDTDLIL